MTDLLMRTPRLPLFIGLVACLLGLGCMTPKAPMEIETPRKFGATSAIRKVVVMPFRGERGAETTSAFATMVEETEVRGKPFFSVIERRKLNNVAAELERVRTGRYTRSDLARIRQQTGAQGVYIGTVDEADVRDTSFVSERDQCKEKENTWRGVLLAKCEEGMVVEVKVGCTRRDVRYTFSPRLVSIETGSIVFGDRYTRSTEAEHCEGDRGTLASADELVTELIETVMSDIQDDITPDVQVVKIPIMELPKNADVSEAQAQAYESAVEFGKADRLDRACEIWRGLRRDGVSETALEYNIALCAEYEGDLESALSILTQTDRKLMRPDENVNRSLRRVRDRIERREEMARTYRELMAKQKLSSSKGQSASKTLRHVQLKLNRLGYDCGGADGMMGARTRSCIQQYQRKHRLAVTGGVTQDLLTELAKSGSPSSVPARISD